MSEVNREFEVDECRYGDSDIPEELDVISNGDFISFTYVDLEDDQGAVCYRVQDGYSNPKVCVGNSELPEYLEEFEEVSARAAAEVLMNEYWETTSTPDADLDEFSNPELDGLLEETSSGSGGRSVF